MKRWLLVAGLLLTGTALLQADEVKVSLQVQQQSVAAVLAELQPSTPETPLLVTSKTISPVTLELSAVPLETALAAIADELKGSCLRAYLLVPKDGPEPQWSADALCLQLNNAMEIWLQELPPDLRKDWTERTEAELRERFEAARLNPATTGPFARPAETIRQAIETEDPLLLLANWSHWENISIGFEKVPLVNVLSDVTVETGYMVLADHALSGEVTLEFDNLPVGEAVEQIAEQVGARAYTFYIVSEPVLLTEAEVQQKIDREFQRAWNSFWMRDPQERQQLVSKAIDFVKSAPPPIVAMVKQEPKVQQLFKRLMDAHAGLSPKQRQEIKPLMQEVIRIMAN